MRTRAAALRIALAGADESDILTAAEAAQLDLRGAKLEGLSGLRRAPVLAGA